MKRHTHNRRASQEKKSKEITTKERITTIRTGEKALSVPPATQSPPPEVKASYNRRNCEQTSKTTPIQTDCDKTKQAVCVSETKLLQNGSSSVARAKPKRFG